jgi:hypothetical protein
MVNRIYQPDLAGRAFVNHIFPLIHTEWKNHLTLSDALHWGTLPKLLQLKSVTQRKDFLRSYALTYVQEEIKLGQLVRNLDPFRSFLEVFAQMNGKLINASKISKQVGASLIWRQHPVLLITVKYSNNPTLFHRTSPYNAKVMCDACTGKTF